MNNGSALIDQEPRAWAGVVFAPHLSLPIRNGADYLIWKRWSEISRYQGNLLLVAQSGTYSLNDGKSECVRKAHPSARSKYVASARSVLFKSHYFFQKYLTPAYIEEAEFFTKQFTFDFAVHSFPATAVGLQHIVWKTAPRRVFVETHNFEPDLYGNACRQARGLRKIPLFISMKTCESWIRSFGRDLRFIHLTKEDREAHERLRPGHHGIVAPIGVDLDADTMLNRIAPAAVPQGLNDRYVIFTGSLGADQNVRAVDHLVRHYLTALRRAERPVRVIVAGSTPSTCVREVCKSSGIELVADPTDEQLRHLLSGALFSVCPFPESAGIKVKLLESLAANVPVLASRCVLFDPRLNVPPNVFSDNPSDWAKAISGRLHCHDQTPVAPLALPFAWNAVNAPILQSLADVSDNP